jgi:hypothetical protein
MISIIFASTTVVKATSIDFGIHFNNEYVLVFHFLLSIFEDVIYATGMLVLQNGVEFLQDLEVHLRVDLTMAHISLHDSMYVCDEFCFKTSLTLQTSHVYERKMCDD